RKRRTSRACLPGTGTSSGWNPGPTGQVPVQGFTPMTRRPAGATLSQVIVDGNGRSTTMFEVKARLKIREGELAGFKEQEAEMLRLTRERDTGTLRYDWFLSADGTECEVREGYVDADALIEHARNVAEARDELFRDFAYDHEMTLYGEPSPALAA